MRNTKFFATFSLILVLFVQLAKAEVSLPAIVSSNMVLQRDTEVVLWGWANAKEKITVKASWLDNELTIKADKEGNWKITVSTTNSKDPQQLSIQSEESNILLENILFGEVWLCSGQSNMYQPVMGYTGQPTFGSAMAIASANNPNLRLFTVNRTASETPRKDVEEYSTWQEASPENVSTFSAIAYFYGQQLQEILGVPVGMIHTSWGGSKVQAWISKEMISKYQEVDLEAYKSKDANHTPTLLYNAMINPLIPYTIKGALWYQGESNRQEPEVYKELFPAMVKDWRTRWGIGDFPFYYVQIAPYWYSNNEAFSSPKNSAFIREAQLQCLDLIPNSGMAVTMDIGDELFIHPPKKKEVAERLLLNALQQTYGFTAVDGLSPIYESMEIKDDGIELKFKNAEDGIYAYDELNAFEIAGEDKVFYPASAEIIRHRTVMVTSEKVPSPVAVRYAWRNWVKGTLFGNNLLPVSSFRTDDWDDATN